MASQVVDGVLWTQTANPAFPNVNVSLTSACQAPLCYGDWTYGEWTMHLQRYANPGAGQPGEWVTIGTRDGYVSSSSPSNRTFTNVASTGAIRVRTVIRSSAYHGSITLISSVRGS
jgi:hypothetical protein